MSKKPKATAIDFDTGIGTIIPATQEAHTNDGFDGQVRKIEKESLVAFKQVIGDQLDVELASNEAFPSDGEIFVFIMQYFGSEKEYQRRAMWTIWQRRFWIYYGIGFIGMIAK